MSNDKTQIRLYSSDLDMAKHYDLADEPIPKEESTIYMIFKASQTVDALKGIPNEVIVDSLMKLARNRLASSRGVDYEVLEYEIKKAVQTLADGASVEDAIRNYRDSNNSCGAKTAESAEVDIAIFHKWSVPDRNGNSKPIGIIDAKICDYLVENNNIITIENKPYIYESGSYKLDEDGIVIQNMIRKLIYKDVVKHQMICECFKLLISGANIPIRLEDINKYPKSWINCRSGMLDAVTLEMHDHNPGYNSINQIPFEYKELSQEEVENSISYKFLNSLIPDPDDFEMYLEFCGLCLTTDTRPQKFMILNGGGGTGKSTALNMLCNVVGTDNLTSLSLQDLNKRFYPTYLLGKLLNACADIPSEKMDVVDVIKRATGEDYLMGEYKGGKSFKFKSHAKLIFSANTMPKVYDDKTDAYYRRLLILEIPQRAEYFENLAERLEKDSQTFFYMMVQALHRYYERGILMESDHSKELVHKLYMGSDSVFSFLEEHTVHAPGKRVDKKELYGLYTKYCDDEGRAALSACKFKENLENKGYSIVKVHGFDSVKNIDLVGGEFTPVEAEALPFD